MYMPLFKKSCTLPPSWGQSVLDIDTVCIHFMPNLWSNKGPFTWSLAVSCTVSVGIPHKKAPSSIPRFSVLHRKHVCYENRANVVQIVGAARYLSGYHRSLFLRYPDGYRATDGKTLCEPSLRLGPHWRSFFSLSCNNRPYGWTQSWIGACLYQ